MGRWKEKGGCWGSEFLNSSLEELAAWVPLEVGSSPPAGQQTSTLGGGRAGALASSWIPSLKENNRSFQELQWTLALGFLGFLGSELTTYPAFLEASFPQPLVFPESTATGQRGDSVQAQFPVPRASCGEGNFAFLESLSLSLSL